MDEIIDGLPGVFACQDDLMVHGMNPAEHFKNLHSVLLRLVEKNFRMNGAKCKIAQTSIPFLGFTIDASGIRPNRVESKSPTNLAELRSITSALQYYSRFVPHFAAHSTHRHRFHIQQSMNCHGERTEDRLHHHLQPCWCRSPSQLTSRKTTAPQIVRLPT